MSVEQGNSKKNRDVGPQRDLDNDPRSISYRLAEQLNRLTDESRENSMLSNKKLADALIRHNSSETGINDQIIAYLTDLQEQQKELALQKETLSNDFAARSRTLQERERRLSEQEQSMSAHFSEQQKKFSKQWETELLQMESEKHKISQERANLEKEKLLQGEEYKRLLEKNSGEYVQETLNKLNNRFCEVNGKATKWQIFGAASLMLGLAYFGLSAWHLNPLDPSLDWKNISYLSLREALIVSLIAGLATYAARTSKILRDEATKIADRMHAIDYGAFYLKTYGANASWDEVKDVFKDWNTADKEIDNQSGQPDRADGNNSGYRSKRRRFNVSTAALTKSE